MATRTETHRRADLLAPDHSPACPKCGDLLEPGAGICLACECYLDFNRTECDRMSTWTDSDRARSNIDAAAAKASDITEDDAPLTIAVAAALTGIGYALLAIHAELRELNGAGAAMVELSTALVERDATT